MTRSDWLLLALNLGALLFAMVGLAAQHTDPMTVALFLAALAMFANGISIVRGRGRELGPRRERQAAPLDELDAATVLDLDARLEALERAHADATDAARWRALVESGQVSAPAADTPTTGESLRQSIANGQGA